MKDIYNYIDKLIDYAKADLELDERDVIYVKNRLLEILSRVDGDDLNDGERDEVYDALCLKPSLVNDKFRSLLKIDPKSATDWLYNYSVKSDYVKKAALDKNPRFESDGLIITINKAKPEYKDPQNAKLGNSVDGGFASCVICRENEGAGAKNKRTLRTVDISLGGEPWFWQYSPYGYFREHGIAVNCVHTPMHVDRSTFVRLMDFVDVFPHYFLGSNAALPRIGGSVLAHDHYQGGGEILPMHRAGAAFTLKHKDFPDAIAEVVDWNCTVIRIVSKNRKSIEDACAQIHEKWIGYNDESCGIVAADGDGVHNAVSPTVIKTDRGYEMNVILRSNITSDKYPDGVFHAHPEFHVIKKESIGLIESQGLFILPGRLESQLGAIESVIDGNKPLPTEYSEFDLIYRETMELCRTEGLNAHAAMQKELGSVCSRILENIAVFKDKRQTVAFLSDLGWKQ